MHSLLIQTIDQNAKIFAKSKGVRVYHRKSRQKVTGARAKIPTKVVIRMRKSKYASAKANQTVRAMR